MKDFYLEATFWIGAVCLIVGMIILFLWLLEKMLNKLGDMWNAMWAVHEYLFYRKDFDKWIKDSGKERHWRTKKRDDETR